MYCYCGWCTMVGKSQPRKQMQWPQPITGQYPIKMRQNSSMSTKGTLTPRRSILFPRVPLCPLWRCLRLLIRSALLERSESGKKKRKRRKGNFLHVFRPSPETRSWDRGIEREKGKIGKLHPFFSPSLGKFRVRGLLFHLESDGARRERPTTLQHSAFFPPLGREGGEVGSHFLFPSGLLLFQPFCLPVPFFFRGRGRRGKREVGKGL